MFIFAYAFKYAKMGGINQGIIQIVTVTAIVYNSFSFYFAFGEVVSVVKIIGMILIICCVVCLGLDSAKDKNLESIQ